MANEKRLIDANALKECVKKRLLNGAIIGWLFRIIDTNPAVDAVPVVRCKDCDNRVYINMGAEIGVVGGCAIYGAALPEDFYCAYGKRGD